MNKNKKDNNNILKCVFLCGGIATGIIKLTENFDLQLCDTCHQLLDPGNIMAWIPC
jgi:hypothetical protein